MSQPVELIVSNVANDVAGNITRMLEGKAAIESELGRAIDDGDIRCGIARGFAERLLCQIAHHASTPVVLKALAAIGAPHEESEIWQRLEAAREARARDGVSPLDTAKEIIDALAESTESE